MSFIPVRGGELRDLEGLACLRFWTDWREAEDNVGKKHELPVTLSPNSLNLAWDLRTSEYFRYSDREKEIPSSGYTDYRKERNII